MTPEELCVTPDAIKILPFMKEVYSLSYGKEPNYEKLALMLILQLKEMGECVSKEYDWNNGFCFHSDITTHQTSVIS